MAGKKKAVHLRVGSHVVTGTGVATVVSKVVEPSRVVIGLLKEGVFHVEMTSVSPGMKFEVLK